MADEKHAIEPLTEMFAGGGVTVAVSMDDYDSEVVELRVVVASRRLGGNTDVTTVIEKVV